MELVLPVLFNCSNPTEAQRCRRQLTRALAALCNAGKLLLSVYRTQKTSFARTPLFSAFVLILAASVTPTTCWGLERQPEQSPSPPVHPVLRWYTLHLLIAATEGD